MSRLNITLSLVLVRSRPLESRLGTKYCCSCTIFRICPDIPRWSRTILVEGRHELGLFILLSEPISVGLGFYTRHVSAFHGLAYWSGWLYLTSAKLSSRSTPLQRYVSSSTIRFLSDTEFSQVAWLGDIPRFVCWCLSDSCYQWVCTLISLIVLLIFIWQPLW